MRCRKGRSHFVNRGIVQIKSEAREIAQSLQYWYRSKYNLTSNDPRFLNTTIDEIQLEYWTEYYYQKIKNGTFDKDNNGDIDLTTDDFDVKSAVQAEIDRINAEAESAESAQQEVTDLPDDFVEI